MKKLILLLCLLPILSHAQIHRCVTDSIHRNKLMNDLIYKSNYLQIEKSFQLQNLLKAATNDTVYTIPVVVHVIYHADNAVVENIEKINDEAENKNREDNIYIRLSIFIY